MSGIVPVVEGFDSDPVSGDSQLVSPEIVESERKHSAEMLEGIDSEFFVEMDDGLRIRPGCKAVASLKELCSQVDVVVDLSIEYHRERAVFVPDRLEPVLDVDDAESSDTHSGFSEFSLTLLVGTAMRNRIEHPRQKS